MLHTKCFLRLLNVGAPEEEITWTQHTTVGLNALAFFHFLALLSFFDFLYHVSVVHNAQHICKTKSNHNGVGLQVHSIFSAQSLHFFKLGWYLSVLQNKNHFTPPKTKRSLKTANLMGLKSCQLRGFFVCASRCTGLWHKMHNCCHVTFFSLDCFLRIHAYSKISQTGTQSETAQRQCLSFVKKR